MAVSLNKMKSTCRISDGKTMIVPAVTVNGGALQADWRDCKLIGIAAVPGWIDLTVGNPISEAVDYAVWAILFIVGCVVVVWIQLENARVDRQSATWDRFRQLLRRPQEAAQAAEIPLSRVQEKSVGSEFRALG